MVRDRLLHWLQLQLAFSCFTDRTERYDEREDDVVWIMRQRTSLQGLLHGLHGRSKHDLATLDKNSRYSICVLLEDSIVCLIKCVNASCTCAP